MEGAEDFFEAPPPLPPPGEPPGPKPWEQPDDVLGQDVHLEPVIARTPNIAIVVSRLTAYPTGFAFVLSVRSKPGHEMPVDGLLRWRRRHGRRRPNKLPNDLFRFGIEFADGSQVTNLQVMGIGAPEQPPPPILLGGGGGGGERRLDSSYWVWPLPPAGSLTFVTEWPAERLPLTRFDVGSEIIRRAAEAATSFAVF